MNARVLLLVAALAGGCLTEEDPEAAGDAEVGDGASVDGASGGGAGDAAVPDAAPLPVCLPVRDRTVALDPEGPDTQIHADVAFDGAGVWVAYNRPDPAGGFDVWVTRLDCEGRVTLPPAQVNTDAEHNDVDPALAVGPAGVLVAWATDDGMGPYNLSIRTRVLGLDGTPASEERRLELTHAGAPAPGNAWMVRAAAHPEGGFVVAGSRGVESIPGFQVFVQRLDAEGAAVGPTWAVAERPEASQTDPALAVDPDGTIRVAWVEDAHTEARLYRARLAPGAGAFVVEAIPDYAAAAPALHPLAPDWIAFSDTAAQSVVLLRDAQPAQALVLGAERSIDHSPGLAAHAAGGAVAWYRVVRGIESSLHVQRVGGEPVDVPAAGPVAAYPAAITYLADGIYFVAWSEGMSPAFRLKGRFIRP